MLDWTIIRDRVEPVWRAVDERGFTVAFNHDLGDAFKLAVRIAASRGVQMRIRVESPDHFRGATEKVEPRAEAGGGPGPDSRTAPVAGGEAANRDAPPNPSAPARDSSDLDVSHDAPISHGKAAPRDLPLREATETSGERRGPANAKQGYAEYSAEER